jgi:excisionase family DNA binding protein
MQSEQLLAIGEVAHALNVSHQTILRFVQSGQWKSTRDGKEWRIPQSSLRNHILQLLGKSGPRAICGVEKENVSKMEKKSQHPQGLGRLYMQKTIDEPDSQKFTPHEAIERLHPLMRKLAWRFGGRNKMLREDLYQEMALAISLCAGTNFLSFYADRAECRAFDLVRKERRKGTLRPGMVRFHNLDHEMHPQTAPKPDCSKVIELFKLAGMSLSLLEEFGIHLIDEGGNDDHVSAEGRNHRDECDDGRNEDLHQGDVARANSPTRAA